MSDAFQVELRTHANVPGETGEFHDMVPQALVAHAAKHALDPKEHFLRVDLAPADSAKGDRVRALQDLRSLVQELEAAGGASAILEAALYLTRPVAAWSNVDVKDLLQRKYGGHLHARHNPPACSHCATPSELLQAISESDFATVERAVQGAFLAVPGISQVVGRYREDARSAVGIGGANPRRATYLEQEERRHLFLDDAGTVVVAARSNGQRVLTCYRGTKGASPEERLLYERDAVVARVHKGRYALEEAGLCDLSNWLEP